MKWKFCTQFHSISYANLVYSIFVLYIYWMQKIIKLNLIFSFIICSCRIVGNHLMILVVVLYRLLYCLLVYYSLLMNSAVLCELCVLIKIWLQFFTLRDNIIICCVNLKLASYKRFYCVCGATWVNLLCLKFQLHMYVLFMGRWWCQGTCGHLALEWSFKFPKTEGVRPTKIGFYGFHNHLYLHKFF